jgi:hypothetical protein
MVNQVLESFKGKDLSSAEILKLALKQVGKS